MLRLPPSARLFPCALLLACVEDPPLPRRAELSVGGEVFHILCKRVAASADALDPSGVQYDGPCDGHAEVPAAAPAASDPRFDALVTRREPVVAALDQVFGDRPTDETGTFETGELDRFLADLVPFYDRPDEVTPRSTRALAAVMAELAGDTAAARDVRATLARVAPRLGYRPLEQALGAVRPALRYPRLDALSREFLRLIAAGGAGHAALLNALDALALELAEDDEKTPNSERTLRRAVELLFAHDTELAPPGSAPLWVVQRDDHGDAVLEPSAPAIDPARRPSPFARRRGEANRDEFGRAIDAEGKPLYATFDANDSVLGALMREQYPLLARGDDERSTVERLSRGLRPLLGPTRLRHGTFGRGARLTFTGPDIEQSAVLDLVHAGAQLLRYDETARLLQALELLMRDHESEATGPVWAALEIDRLADLPEYAGAKLVGVDGEGTPSEFWDDLIDVGMRMAERPGQLEAVLRAFGRPDSVAATQMIAKFMRYRDDVHYEGYPLTLQSDGTYSAADARRMNAEIDHAFALEVDRSLPDVGMNRSLWQRMISAIHATNGVANCNKQGGKLHASDPLTGAALVFPDPLTQPGADLLVAGAATLFCPPPQGMTGSYDVCEMVRQPNGAEAHMRSIVGKSIVVIKDTQLTCLEAAGLAKDLGETQEASSQITGFTLQPTPRALARFVSAPRVDFLTSLFDPFPTRHGVPFVEFEPNILFALEAKQQDVVFDTQRQSFLTSSVALTSAFDETELFEETPDGPVATRGYMFAELLSTLHMHWPSRRLDPATGEARGCSSRVERGDEGCSQSAASDAPFYAAQSNLVSYEPLLIRAVEEVRVAEALQRASAALMTISVDGRDGIRLLAEFVQRVLEIDPALRYRDGRAFAVTNTCVPLMTAGGDSSEGVTCAEGRGRIVPGVSPLYLVLDALRAVDDAFETADDGEARHVAWLAARSSLVDRLLTVERDDSGGEPAFRLANRRGRALTLQILPWLRALLEGHREAGDLAAWADGLTGRAADVLGHPAVAAALDLLDVAWDDARASAEFAAASAYFMDEAHHPEAFRAMLLTAADTLHLLDRDPDLTPLLQFASLTLAPDAFTKVVAQGDVTLDAERGAVATGVELARRVAALEDQPEPSTLTKMLGNLVVPDAEGVSPLEAILDATAEVNRQDPTRPRDEPLDADDYQALFAQTHAFLADPDRGMERLFAVIRSRTLAGARAEARERP